MEVHVDHITPAIKNLATVARMGSSSQYQGAAAEVITRASDLRTFLSGVIMKADDFTFKQNLNFSLMQLSDTVSLLIQSSNNAYRANSPDSVQAMVNCAVKIARITKECHTALLNKAEGV